MYENGDCPLIKRGRLSRGKRIMKEIPLAVSRRQMTDDGRQRLARRRRDRIQKTEDRGRGTEGRGRKFTRQRRDRRQTTVPLGMAYAKYRGQKPAPSISSGQALNAVEGTGSTTEP
jgi:hypothetical protein